jgi:signal transduction histidine kinase
MPGAVGVAALALAAGAVALVTWRRARVAGRMKRIAHASHELRGALNAIGLALGGMDDPAVEALWAQHGRAVLAIDDLDTAHAREQRPSPPMSTAPVDLEALVRQSVRSWAAVHGRWRVVLDWRAGRAIVSGHAARLCQALDNLIANALEHGGGPVTLVGRSAGDSVTVSILDRGRGGGRALEPARAASWRSRRGHGLAIARRAVEDHGGSLRFVRERRGAGVEVRLPLAPGASSPSTAVRPAPRPPGVARSA